MNLENAAYSKEYEIRKNKFIDIFVPEKMISENKKKISDKYSFLSKFYQGVVDGYPVHCMELFLLNSNDEILYSYKNLDTDSQFCSFISHSDGNNYMIFRCDLYGYSVLKLTTMQDFHYYPKCAFLNEETFIWTGVDYNPLNNMLAVSGCYWACPYGVLLIDFSNPLAYNSKQLYLYDILDPNHEKYDDIDFSSWQNTDLLLICYESDTGQKSDIILSENEYLQWFNKVL